MKIYQVSFKTNLVLAELKLNNFITDNELNFLILILEFVNSNSNDDLKYVIAKSYSYNEDGNIFFIEHLYIPS